MQVNFTLITQKQMNKIFVAYRQYFAPFSKMNFEIVQVLVRYKNLAASPNDRLGLIKSKMKLKKISELGSIFVFVFFSSNESICFLGATAKIKF